jgi:2-hydroxy-3-keto-5-methylthiopentenyl-1-phosphate phosphatase
LTCCPGSVARMDRIDLSAASVFLDFDGTITCDDTGVYLLQRLAPPDRWHDLERRYIAGEIGSKACMIEEWALLPRDRARVERVVAEVALDDGFLPLVAALRGEGAEVSILSDGFGFRADQVGTDAGVPVITNAIDWASWEVRFPNEVTDCECAECGACKRAPIRAARSRGRTTVIVGDGASDVKAAVVADLVFAKGDLADWCARNAIAFEPWDTLADVQRTLTSPS